MTRTTNGYLIMVVAVLLAGCHHLDAVIVHHQSFAGVVELVGLLLMLMMLV